jgi:hypothetical protein
MSLYARKLDTGFKSKQGAGAHEKLIFIIAQNWYNVRKTALN